MKLNPHLHLVPRLRKSGAMLLLPLYAFLVSTGTLLTDSVVALQYVHCLSHWQCITVCWIEWKTGVFELNSRTFKKTKQPENIQYRQTVDPICLLIVRFWHAVSHFVDVVYCHMLISHVKLSFIIFLTWDDGQSPHSRWVRFFGMYAEIMYSIKSHRHKQEA
jgi:hypothetical protein